MKYLKNILHNIKKWYMVNYPTKDQRAKTEEQRVKGLQKALAKFSWQLAQMEAEQTYINQVGDSKISFSDGVIRSANKSVKREQDNNPEWDEWVREWQNETHII